MDKVKARIDAKQAVYIHNDLGNCAYHFKKRFDEWGEQEGIGLEVMAGLTMIAFTAEARFNFLGWKLIDGWNERQTLKDKAKEITKTLGIEADFGQEPYSTLMDLKDFRDDMAHGKPIVLNELKEVVTTQDELAKRGVLEANWERFATQKFFNLAYEHTEQIWKQLLEVSGIEIFETISHGEHTVTFLAHIPE